MGDLHLCSTLSPYMECCQASLVALDTFLGWPLRRARVARQVFLCVENGATNWQPPRGLRPESTRPSRAASRGHQFPRTRSPCPPLLPPAAPTSKAGIGQERARLNRPILQFPCSRPVHAPSL